MLKELFKNDLALGFAQAAVAALLALAVALLARSRGIRLISEAAVSMLRGLAQIVAVGFALIVLLKGPWWTAPFALAGMVVAAAFTAARRVKRIPGAWRVALQAIAFGAGSVIVLLAIFGVIDISVSALVPVGSMLIANAMNGASLALERFRADVEAHVGEIETALALGAAPAITVQPYAQAALRASLIPPMDNIRTLGIVWIPGLMAGMILSTGKPLYASIYQFVVLAGIFAASGLTCLMAVSLISRCAFSPAEQLLAGHFRR